MDTNFARSIAATTLSIVLMTACSGSTPTAPAGPAGPAPPTSGLTGTYSLTFAASPECNRDGWAPDFVPSRTYQATVNGILPWQLIYLTGATFAPGIYAGNSLANVISLTIRENSVTLYFEDGPIIEALPSGDPLWIYGHASGTVTDAVTELSVVGEFAGCNASTHKLTMRRVSP